MADLSLIEAVKSGSLADVQELLEADADVNERLGTDTALHWAADKGYMAIARLLVDYGADLSAVTGGYTARNIAGSSGHKELAAFLATAVQQPALGTKPQEKWVPAGATSVAFVEKCLPLGRQLTQIFNFETRQHVLLSENMVTQAEAMAAPTSFDDLPTPVLEKALAEFRNLGGAANSDYVLQGNRGLGKPAVRLRGPEAGND